MPLSAFSLIDTRDRYQSIPCTTKHPAITRSFLSVQLQLERLLVPKAKATLDSPFRFSDKPKMPTTLPPPSKPLTKGLDFSSKVYLPDEDSLEVFNRDSAEVLEWIRDNLQASTHFQFSSEVP